MGKEFGREPDSSRVNVQRALGQEGASIDDAMTSELPIDGNETEFLEFGCDEDLDPLLCEQGGFGDYIERAELREFSAYYLKRQGIRNPQVVPNILSATFDHLTEGDYRKNGSYAHADVVNELDRQISLLPSCCRSDQKTK